MSSNELISIKELASKLKVTDALLKKLIKDFDIVTERVQKRVYLSESSVTTVREVLALRASGKKNKEIKELFEESKAMQAAPAVEAEKPTDVVIAEETSTETVTSKVKPDHKKAKPAPRKTKAKKPDDIQANNEEQEQVAKITEESISPTTLEHENTEEHAVDISSYLEEDQQAEDEPSMAMRLAEESGAPDEVSESTEDEGLDFEESAEDEKDSVILEEPERNTDRSRQDRLSPRKMRRRQFSFSYIQRQIANDSKRIHYIQQKLKRGSLSTKETMNLKDSLEHRSKLLSGWVHLLRWVKS